ncbi:DUF262 domain-containing protein [Pseudomonas fulva]|uniref:DUF262 domain-containing protein n=1 Tax=Pseudomonas fulva TaxID=47880 RepID=UPI0018A8A467|nr:DUF262 domain-containing protein [Pseudomonas fulva]MBF8676793.1 DUF262 domain-containing protein [Pseudomonas fulva]MBF8696873.1 DUF262 domain-containing protein [Pseudomonas fulva]
MRLVPWDPDIQTVINRIDSLALDLQPNFQRGEVWPRSKKQKLIDSVLREWHVPPIHVIENPSTRKQEVLDGQQRLVAIRDFVRGEFAVDGFIEPIADNIQVLDGLKYRTLPDEIRRQFDQFTLRLYRIVDFNPSEPAELFYRLNQPSNLTGAEQRNAFYGPVRDQIRDIVVHLESLGIGKDQFGFSNSRMAYDDVVCRVALTVKRGTIAAKIIGNDLVELYRSENPLDEDDCLYLKECLTLFAESCDARPKPKFNKATLYSWLVFVVRGTMLGVFERSDARFLGEFLTYFYLLGIESSQDNGSFDLSSASSLIPIYDDRATSRVADVSSILLRDFIIWRAFVEFARKTEYCSSGLGAIERPVNAILSRNVLDPDALSKTIQGFGWGEL